MEDGKDVEQIVRADYRLDIVSAFSGNLCRRAHCAL